jgi:hypothetical protein
MAHGPIFQASMKTDGIAFIVPVKEGMHALYTRDGRIITIGNYSGNVLHVATLPSDEDIAKKVAEPKKHPVLPPSVSF